MIYHQPCDRCAHGPFYDDQGMLSAVCFGCLHNHVVTIPKAEQQPRPRVKTGLPEYRFGHDGKRRRRR